MYRALTPTAISMQHRNPAMYQSQAVALGSSACWLSERSARRSVTTSKYHLKLQSYLAARRDALQYHALALGRHQRMAPS